MTNGTVDSDYAKVLTYNTTTKTVEFTGTAENLTPLQFVAKYFYGTAADRYGNQNASNTEMRLFAQAAAKSKLLSNGVPATGADDEVQFTNLPEGLYLIVRTARFDIADAGACHGHRHHLHLGQHHVHRRA